MRKIQYILQYMIELDQIDNNILRELGKNGRISNIDLAHKVGLSPSACLRRVQELERQDIITGYRAITNKSKLGIGIVAFITVGLKSHRKEDQERFEHLVAAANEVTECHNITGAFEYLLRVEVKDLEDYKRFHTEILGTIPSVNSITSHICMESPKDLRG